MLLAIRLCSLPQYNVHHCIPFPVVINPGRMEFSKYHVANKNANCTVLVSWSLQNKVPHTGCVKSGNLFSYSFMGQKSPWAKIILPVGCVPFGDSREDPFLCLFQLLVVTCVSELWLLPPSSKSTMACCIILTLHCLTYSKFHLSL